MRLLLRTNDPVVLSFARSVLADAGVEAEVFDEYVSLVEGSIGAFPRRLMVDDGDLAVARQALTAADLGAWIVGNEGA